MNLQIKGKRALVLGSSTGIGRGIAEVFIQEGATTAICARNEERLKRTAAEIGATAAIAADLSQPGNTRQLIEAARAQLSGNIDILVVNTGGPPKGKFPEITIEQWQEGFNSLWISAVEAINAVLPEMRANHWGRILLVTSVAAKEPMPGLTVSNGLRAGLLGLMKSICHEVAASGVTINAVLPGYTRTERLQELGIDETKMTTQIPAGRLGRTDELGALSVFLCSEQAAYITGQAIAFDGGYLRGL